MNMDIDIFYGIMRKSLKENDIDGFVKLWKNS